MHTTGTEPLKLASQTARKKKNSQRDSMHVIPPQRKPSLPPYTHKTPYISKPFNDKCIYNAENNRTHTHLSHQTLNPEGGTLTTIIVK
jgi:hypothetical protein